MDKTALIDTIKTALEKRDDENFSPEKVLETLNSSIDKYVEGIVSNKNEILEEKKQLKAKFEEEQKTYEEIKAKLNKIGNVDQALEAIEHYKNRDKDLEQQIISRTSQMKEAHRLELENEKKMRLEAEKKAEKLIVDSRDQSFKNRIKEIGRNNGVRPDAESHLVYSVCSIFKYDEEEDAYIPKDSSGTRISSSDPVKAYMSVEEYIKEKLPVETPFLYVKNSNMDFGGSKKQKENVWDYFDKVRGTPNMKFANLKSTDPERAAQLEKLKEKEMKKD